MMDQDVRWKQRFANYRKALQLQDFVIQPSLNVREAQGLIQCFEYTFELAWNVMRDLLIYRGATTRMMGSKDVIRVAFKENLITDGRQWMTMVEDRNKSVHSYNEETVEQISGHILNSYFKLFKDLETGIDKIDE